MKQRQWIEWQIERWRDADAEVESTKRQLALCQRRSAYEREEGKNEGLRLAARPQFAHAVETAVYRLVEHWSPALREEVSKILPNLKTRDRAPWGPDLHARVDPFEVYVDTVEFTLPAAHYRVRIARF